MSRKTQHVWDGEQNRPLAANRPCECGCDARGGLKGVGYLTGSNEKGEGFTIWIQNESVFQRLSDLVEAEGQS